MVQSTTRAQQGTTGWAAAVVLASCLLHPAQLPAGTDRRPAHPGQAGDAVPAAPVLAAAEAGRDRPQRCLDGTMGKVRIQIGTVEALAIVGKDLLLPVRVKGVCDLAAFTLGIQLDRRVAELVRVEQTPFLQGDPPVDVEFFGLDSASSAQVIRAFRPKGTGGVDGVGTLVRLVIRGRTPGSTQIRVVRPRLLDPASKLIDSYTVPVRVTVLETMRGARGPFSRPRRQPRRP